MTHVGSVLYRCELVARSPDTGGEWLLGRYLARTPRLALRWLRGRAFGLAEALEPSPGRVFLAWASDLPRQERQLGALAAGLRIGVTAGGRDRVCGREAVRVFYSLSSWSGGDRQR